jgi:phosphoribosyl 1,2-cyclic phosphodiesterase
LALRKELSGMRIKFWGVRGSIAVPGPDTVEVGGNTSCVEVRCDNTLVILDGGTGIRLLGQSLLSEMPIEAYVFFSHVHWDHIQGFPFFTPAFIPGNRFHMYGGNNVTHTLEETLAGQMDYPSFPVTLTDMAAHMSFHDLREGQTVRIGDQNPVEIVNTRGNHPNGVFAYRLTHRGKSLVYATDTEHYSVVDPKLARLAKDADVLIYDTMYLPEEYSGEVGGVPKTGWGHSTYVHGVELAKAANVRKLVLFHHDPGHSDAIVAAKEKRAQALFPNCEAAREGLTIEL